MHRIEPLWSLSGTQTLMYSLTWIDRAGDAQNRSTLVAIRYTDADVLTDMDRQS